MVYKTQGKAALEGRKLCLSLSFATNQLLKLGQVIFFFFLASATLDKLLHILEEFSVSSRT